MKTARQERQEKLIEAQIEKILAMVEPEKQDELQKELRSLVREADLLGKVSYEIPQTRLFDTG